MTNREEYTNYVASLIEDKCDHALGARVQEHLAGLGLVSIPDDEDADGIRGIYKPHAAVEALKEGVRSALFWLGLDVANDPSLQDTPKRYAHMLVGELTKGLNFDFFPKCTTTPNGAHNKVGTLVGAYDQMVRVNNIETISLCEHHLQTIDGFTHVAYIPSTKVLGLSKFARIVEFFARRPQIQERMTEQIFETLKLVLETEDVAVVQTATHFCMRARGARQHASTTTTDKMGGRFLSNVALREEFLHGIR